MKKENLNELYLRPILEGEGLDFWYHLGIANTEPFLKRMKGLKAVVVAGSGDRIRRMAHAWAELKCISISDMIHFPKEERFVIYYTGGVLFCSHGMGMPSASIAIQELMKLVYFVKGGDPAKMDEVFWCRVGTSGGLCNPGDVVVTTEGLMSDFGPYRLFSLGREVSFDSRFPDKVADEIITANEGSGLTIVKGKTIGCNSFYIEQNRVDGAVCLCTGKQKEEWLQKAYDLGVRNIEMEAPMIAGFLNHWGFSKFAVICCALVNRMKGDQVAATAAELAQYSINAEQALWNYLKKTLS